MVGTSSLREWLIDKERNRVMLREMSESIERAGGKIEDLHIFESKNSRLSLFDITLAKKRGIILHFENPPVHQISSQSLDYYASAFLYIEQNQNELSFVIFSFAPDATHAGGDLKETLANLSRSAGYDWADQRLLKAFALYKRVRALAKHMRVISILSGGDYYGGSAEVALWADTLIGDSRTSICMSEAIIGLISGWGGVARLIAKAGVLNARCLVETARKTNAHELKAIGVLDSVVDIPYTLPNGGSEEERRHHAHKTLTPLLINALAFASGKIAHQRNPSETPDILMSEDVLEAEVDRRSDPYTYRDVWGKPLAEVRDVLAIRKMPLAPQSIVILQALWNLYGTCRTEEEFVHLEMMFDAALYRHPSLAEGIRAVLNKQVPCFTLLKEKGKRT